MAAWRRVWCVYNRIERAAARRPAPPTSQLALMRAAPLEKRSMAAWRSREEVEPSMRSQG